MLLWALQQIVVHVVVGESRAFCVHVSVLAVLAFTEMEMTPSQTAGENGSDVAGKGNHCFTPDLQKRALITLP